MPTVSHSSGPEPFKPPNTCWSAQLHSTMQPWRLLKSILSQPVQRMAILANVSRIAEKHKRLAFWHLGKRSVRDRRRKANLPADSSGKNEQNRRLFLCDRHNAFRAAPSARAESTHMRVAPAAVATPRRRERRFQGSADQSGGCLALWPHFESGAGAQPILHFSRKLR